MIGNIHTQIEDFKPVSFKHKNNDIFADIMHIARYRTNNDFPSGGYLTFHQFGFDQFDTRLKNLCDFDNLRDVEFIIFKLFTDNIHTRDQALFDNCVRVGPVVQQFPGFDCYRVTITRNQRILKYCIVWHF